MARPKKLDIKSAITKQKTQIICPVIQVAGETHPLQEMWDGGEAPEMKSVGYMRMGPSNWVSYLITTRGTEVIKIEIDEPNHKAIAEESAKINFVQAFVDAE